jgi:hypothetical protein
MNDIYDVFHRLVNPKPMSEPEQIEAHDIITRADDARKAAQQPDPMTKLVQDNAAIAAREAVAGG